jgi:ACS family tartrate transporter-like MFS transporter
VMGYFKDLTGSFTVGLLILAACALIGAVVATTLSVDSRVETSGAQPAPAG